MKEQSKNELRIPKETANAYQLLADVAGVTIEQAMKVCLALSLMKFMTKKK